MKNQIGKKEEDIARDIVAHLQDNGFTAYWVGGCVRDKILGLPIRDIDIATDATPPQVEKLFTEVKPIGAAFGVSLVIEKGRPYEVATFRSETGYADSRHPDQIKFSDAETDVQRRDFTMNGIFFDPIANQIIDFVGGQDAIKNKRIETIGNAVARFTEDALRMLRAIRFAAQLNFTISDEILTAIREVGPAIRHISSERIFVEISKILASDRPELGLDLLDQTGLLSLILPEVKTLQGVEQPAEFHPEGDVYKHTRLMLELMKKGDAVLGWGILMHDTGKPATQTFDDRIRFNGHVEKGVEIANNVTRRFKMSKLDRETIKELVRHHMRFIDIQRMRRAKQIRFVTMPDFDRHLELHRVDCLSSHGGLELYDYSIQLHQEVVKELANRPPTPLLTGKDLIALGYKPGPIFQQILTALQDAQLEGVLSTKADAQQFLLKSDFNNSRESA